MDTVVTESVAATQEAMPTRHSSAPFKLDTRMFIMGLMLGLLSGAVFGLGLGWMTAGSSTEKARPAAEVAAPGNIDIAPTPMEAVDVNRTTSGARAFASMGLETAPVKIVVFADPQCPFCKAMATGMQSQLIEHYVKAGKAQLIYRHFAFLGPESGVLAAAMECAGQQKQFWAFHDYVFQNQLPENSGAITAERIATWAKASGVADVDAMQRCMIAPETQKVVEQDKALGTELGVRGTPTLFVNGKPLVGAVPYDFVVNAIEAQLSGRP